MEANRLIVNGKEHKHGIQFILAHPPPGEEIVVSGFAGKFPNSENAYELRDNLYKNLEMISDNENKFSFHDDIPQRTGKVNGLSIFDPGFFGSESSQADNMDPMIRIILEKTIEAIMDAGINPNTLAGTKTGVYIGICASETEKNLFFETGVFTGETILGCIRNQAAQRISYHLRVNGPSYTCDTACSSSAYALEQAYRDIRMGKCDQAIVGGANLCLFGTTTFQFARLGVLSPEGVLKAFDQDANGYVRSEAFCVMLLQKIKDARRIYCKIVHAKVSCDGYKSEGITFPSGSSQAELLKEFYEECEIPPAAVSYIEAHGTATKVGDPQEVFAISSIFCKNRSEPLMIGSIKSNIGHTEPTSGLCSLVKVIFAMETGYIPANINFKTPKREITALHDGRMKVVTENTFWNDDRRLATVNNFGFGGANCHVLVECNEISKINNGLPKDDLPRLVCISGRTPEAIDAFFDDIKSRKLDAEYIRLFHEIYRDDMPNEIYRGFSIFDKKGELKRSVNVRSRPQQTCLILSELDDELWLKFGKELLAFPIFEDAMKRLQSVLQRLEAQKFLNLGENNKKENAVRKLFGAIMVQISLLEVISEIGFEPDYLMGQNLGELICVYYDGLLNLEQLLIVIYYVGLSKFKYGEKTDSTLFTKNNDELSKIIDFEKLKATKWIRNGNSSNLTLLNVLLRPIQTEDAANILSDETIVVYLSNNNNSLNLIDFASAGDSVLNLLTNLGRLYQTGVNLNLAKLYPKIQWPVSRGTPMISPIVKWEHSKDWHVVAGARETFNSNSGVYVINVNYNDWAFLKGHVIDGNTLFPAAGYLYLVWDYVSEREWSSVELFDVIFQNVKFLRASSVSPEATYKVSIDSYGNFEVTERDVLLVTGNVSQLQSTQENFTEIDDLDENDDENEILLYQKDIYKELRLRNYNYTGEFQAIQTCNTSVTTAVLKWDDNWVTFIDNMLQLNILQSDTKNLYVPTGIAKLLISCGKLKSHVRKDGLMPVYCKKEANITNCKGVEMVGLDVSQISKRKILTQPVLESYEFVPNEGVLQQEQCVRVNTQIILENLQGTIFKMVEVFQDQSKRTEPLSLIIQKALADQPLIQPEIKLLSDIALDFSEITVANEPLSDNNDCLLVVAIDLFANTNLLTQAINAIHENGYIISRQDKTFVFPEKFEKLELITCYKTELETIVLLKKRKYEKQVSLDVTDSMQDLNWVPKLQQLSRMNNEIVIVSQNVEYNGILGFFNCLHREPNGSKFMCVLLLDKTMKFKLNEEFYQRQLRKGLAVNVFKDGKWGTYRHLLLKPSEVTKAETAFVSVINPGDLSTLTWIEGPLTPNNIEKDQELVHVYYSALNFRDVLTASGRIPVDFGVKTRVLREGYQGLEFSGKDSRGKRVFGMVSRGALSTLLAADSRFLWDVPDEWTMDEAVTIPVVYATVLYAFVTVAHIRRGQTILIHNGSGGVGQAAINVALFYNCTIFTTVGTEEKKAFVLKHFPQIKEEHIGNSRDTSFEQMIFNHTNGKGVDIALNPLTQEKLQATVRCVAKGGSYLEIGKADVMSNSDLSLQLFKREIKAAGVMLDFINDDEGRRQIFELVSKHIKFGAVKPLHKVVYESEDIEAAFRYMGTGKHMGKVVIKIRQEENNRTSLPTKLLFKCKPIFYCNPKSTYIIIGGLGGVGLELADRLIVKGCTKLILVSRQGVKTGYQTLKLRYWKKYASIIHVSTEDVTTKDGCIRLLKKANEFGPVDGIFNLAVDLKDALFEDQSVETFTASIKPKPIATHYLDILSRKLCPHLRYFVVFSSVSAGRGNPGQTNYGLANSIMENICEKRRSEGLPALAIQWGAIGDVGLVANMNELNKDIIIGGTLQQRISNCLDVLDMLLCQDKVIVSSMVVAEKTIGGNFQELICNILGIKNVENVNQQLTLAELGMDSITGLEIKQIIERQFDIMLSVPETKNMTFLKLKDLSENKTIDNKTTQESTLADKNDWMKVLLRFLNKTEFFDLPSVQLNCHKESQNLPEVSFLPGINGMSNVFEPILPKLNCRANVCQFLFVYQNNSIESLAKEVIKYVKQNNSTFTLVAYSFGCLVALEVIALLEAQGYMGRAVFIDGSPQQLKNLVKPIFLNQDEDIIKMRLFRVTLQSVSFVFTKELEEELASRQSSNEKIDYITKKIATASFSPKYLQDCFYVTYERVKATNDYECSFKKLKSKVVLFRPKVGFHSADDYGLSVLFEEPVTVRMFDGDHESILKNDEMAEAINEFIHNN